MRGEEEGVRTVYGTELTVVYVIFSVSVDTEVSVVVAQLIAVVVWSTV